MAVVASRLSVGSLNCLKSNHLKLVERLIHVHNKLDSLALLQSRWLFITLVRFPHTKINVSSFGIWHWFCSWFTFTSSSLPNTNIQFSFFVLWQLFQTFIKLCLHCILTTPLYVNSLKVPTLVTFIVQGLYIIKCQSFKHQPLLRWGELAC